MEKRRCAGCMNVTQEYICEHCGNIVVKVHDAGVPLMCCGQKMKELIPGTVEASVEKHVPAVSVEGSVVKVEVGSVAHPMVEEHYIPWVCLQTSLGYQLNYLSPREAPRVYISLAEGEKPVAVYEWCNLHGLWKTEL